MKKIVLCEDELSQQKLIKGYIEKIFESRNEEYDLLIYRNGESLIEDYPKNIDIFLLDIQLEEIDGMTLARKIRSMYDKNVEIIFTTSLIDYVQEGYEVRAYRYLLKPIKLGDLERHLISCFNEIERNKGKELILSSKTEIFKINTADIYYIEVLKREITIHTKTSKHSINMTMDNIESKINQKNFHRCHKSYLVNLDYVVNVKQYVATMENKEEVPISRYRFKEFKEVYLESLLAVL
ncbi:MULTISPECIES: LytTR family DNA-binding domain-containing protein [unclassified Clostridioides]|uniref:LytR/AlgR family response regulator transcription factor n=1 Tax=unclassified Clostridioides TaxID=2635829 RepID=UPI001D0F82D6|nr:response regulator transcription factor [Clostridioides sp. ES-S-0171-01]MCC0688799.1 response regulator transcription factor [Clostridioides sp. ES-S-0056-01]UDN54180.1 response regulator transcription factor [Clostridioides sp. ES-S-0054-01]